MISLSPEAKERLAKEILASMIEDTSMKDSALKQKMRDEFMARRRKTLGVEDEAVKVAAEPEELPELGDLPPNHQWLHEIMGWPQQAVSVPIEIHKEEDWDPLVRPFIPDPITGYKYRQEFYNFAVCVEMGLVGALVGEPGTGKDAMGKQLAAIKRMPYRRIMGDRNKTQDTIIGRRTMQDGTILWEPGELELVTRNGGMVVMSEPFAFPPDTLFAIQSMIERGGFLSLVEHPDPKERMLPLHPKTRVVLTTNTRGVGDDQDKYAATGVMDASTLNRLEYMQEVGHLDAEAEAAVIYPDLVADAATALAMVRFGNMMRQAWRVGEIEASWSLRNLVPWAELMKRGFNVRDAFMLTYYGKLGKDKEREAAQRCWHDCGFSIAL